MGSPVGLPPGFKLDESAPDTGLPPGFKLDEPAAESTGLGPGSTAATKLITGVAKGGGRAALSLINPLDWMRSAKALAALGYKLGKPPVTGQPYEGAQALEDIGTGAKDVVKQALTDPESAGEVLGSTGVSLLGPKALGAAGSLAARLALRSRASNIVRAVSGGKELVPTVVKAGDEAQLPISLTQGSLARKLAEREAAAGEAVGATKEVLPGTVSAASIADLLPTVGQTVEGIPVTGARPLRRAVERSRAYWEDVATQPGFSGEIPRPVVAALKEEAQGEAARGGAYSKGTLGLPVTPGAKAAAEEASALRTAALDTTGLSAEDAAKVAAYERALKESSLATALSEPAQMEHLRKVSGAGGGDWKASLVGRVLAPGIIGGTVGALGGVATSPLGALAGMGVAEFMKSTLWNTFSAATKLKAARALESGGVGAFRDVVVRAAMADVERRRLAEQALRSQGEGVLAR